MSLLGTVFLKLKRFLLAVLGVLRRGLCCRRSRKNSGMLLPVTVEGLDSAANSVNDYRARVSNQYSSAAQSTWQSYNHQRHDGRVAASYGANPLGNPSEQLSAGFAADTEDAGEQDVDFFSDMAPRIKRQKKILLASGEEQQQSPNTSKFGVDLKASIGQVRVVMFNCSLRTITCAFKHLTKPILSNCILGVVIVCYYDL